MKRQNEMEKRFLESYEVYNDAIFRYCYFKTSDREKALDLTQDTFTKTWEYMAAGKKIDNIKAFLYRVATNSIVDEYRRKKSESLDELREEGYDPSTDEHEKTLSALEGEEIMKYLKDLDEPYKEILTLRFIHDLSIDEIIEITGESGNTISVRIHRAIDKLKNQMKNKTV
jgi:RNA polymerase sigma-70 factor (ECF subfamily)